MKEAIYISLDIESDGPCPLVNSMLSLGAAAFSEGGAMLGTFIANLQLTPGAVSDKGTMDWWETQPDAWAACRANTVSPDVAMRNFRTWLDGLRNRGGERLIPIAYPAGFDFTFVKVYLHKFAGDCPLGFQCLDLKTLAMSKIGCRFDEVGKRTMPKSWFGPSRHTHVAVDDAIEQGEMYFRMRKP